jgi:hypothetical protein
MTATSAAPRGEVVLYEASDAELRLEVKLERESVWLSQAQMVELFQRDQSVVSGSKRNGALLGRDGAPRFADNALLALALLTAESEPVQKDLLVRLTINLMVDPATSARA